MRTTVWMLAGAALLAAAANAQTNGCAALPNNTQLKKALTAARSAESSGLNAQEWATIVDRNGVVCAVAFTGPDPTTQMGIGRISSAMRANSANAFAFDANSSSDGAGFAPGLALSTSNLYSATQPGGFVAGVTNSFPVNQAAAFSKKVNLYGTEGDPMIGQPIGGFIGIGGGVALFGTGQVAMGGLGVAGDHSCTDHDIAWRTRNLLNLDHLGGFPPLSGDPGHPDNIVYDITPNPAGGVGISASGLGHPKCPNLGDQTKLPAVRP
ncbi:MAG TPA: hypothetical protein VKB79_23210 [Bryobacteraceae bacterium]|nr:hypothetical protein [Bryobacteraceae bacterium]